MEGVPPPPISLPIRKLALPVDLSKCTQEPWFARAPGPKGELEVVQCTAEQALTPLHLSQSLKQSPMGNSTAQSPWLQVPWLQQVQKLWHSEPLESVSTSPGAEFCQGTRFDCQQFRPQKSGKDSPSCLEISIRQSGKSRAVKNDTGQWKTSVLPFPLLWFHNHQFPQCVSPHSWFL